MRSRKFALTSGADFMSQEQRCNSGLLPDRVKPASSLQDSCRHDARTTGQPGWLRYLSPANPWHRVTGETGDRLHRAQATIHRFVRASTRPCHQSAQSDSGKAVRGRNEVVRWERDYSPGARGCRDRYAEVSIQNAASTDNRRVKPSQRTRFASRSAVGTARRTAVADSDRPVWL